MNRPTLQDVAVFCGLAGCAFATRLLMIEPNFHAVTAAALFAGFYFRNRAVAACVPLLAMVASDWVIGGYSKEVMIVVYAAMVLPIALGGILRSRLSAGRVAGGAVGCSLLFFLATNAAVWHVGFWYARSWQGLAECYAAGLPFLANALAGDLIFSAAFFGAYAVALNLGASASRHAVQAVA